MTYCTQCGTAASEEDKFCSGCGKKLTVGEDDITGERRQTEEKKWVFRIPTASFGPAPAGHSSSPYINAGFWYGTGLAILLFCLITPPTGWIMLALIAIAVYTIKAISRRVRIVS